MNKIIRTIAVVAAAGSLGGCWNGVYETPATEYLQRTDKITLGAGDANDVNAATNVVDPWPRRAGDRRIPGQADHLVNVIEGYKGRSAGSAGGQQNVQSSAPSSTGIVPSGAAAVPSSTLPY